MFEGCNEPFPAYELELVLKKWCDIVPSSEFRCFVRDDTLIGALNDSA